MNLTSDIPGLVFSARLVGLMRETDWQPDPLAALYSQLKAKLVELPIHQSDDGNYRLQNASDDHRKQMSLVLRPIGLSFMWGQEVPERTGQQLFEHVLRVCSGAQPDLQALVRHVETEYVIDINVRGNHYAFIHDVFYSRGPLSRLLTPGRRAYENDVTYRVLLTDDVVLIVRVIGQSTHADVIADSQRDKPLRIRMSVGLTKIDQGALVEESVRHIKTIEKLATEELFEKFVLPVAQAAASRS